jgi:alanine racemase
MRYTFSNIREALPEALCVQSPFPGTIVETLLLDSRQQQSLQRALFFALVGPQHDGHQYIDDCYAHGVRNFIVEAELDWKRWPNANILKVDSSLSALQSLALQHRHHFELSVIGITGSNGKTIVKEWLFQLLRNDFNIVRSPRSYNSQTGVPLSLWLIRPDHQLGLFEAGISQPGEMERLAPLIDCQIGIFTNIGEAHSSGFETMHQKIQEKLRLFERANTIIYCADHKGLSAAIESRFADRNLLSWTRTHIPASIHITEYYSPAGATSFDVYYQNTQFRFQIPFNDAASKENALHCLALLLHLGVSSEDITARMSTLEAVAMRLEIREGMNGCTLINDTYNSDPDSLRIALQFMKQQRPEGRKTLILSDMLQSCDSPADLYARLASDIKAYGIKQFFGIGPDIEAIQSHLEPNIPCQFFPSTNEFLRHLPTFRDETILIKGARRFALEQITNRLTLKAHQTILEIDLNALQNNLRVFRQILHPGVQLLLMVKASGYGSGADEVARMLEFQQVDYLGVAYIDEGVALRRAGIRIPILVLNPEETGFNDLFEYELEPEVYKLSLLKELVAFKPEGQQLCIHIKLETGMNRLGFAESDLPELLLLLETQPDLQVRSIFSHLAASEDASSDAFTTKQALRFENMSKQLEKALGYKPLRHLLNSEGILRFPQFQYNMVRLGIGFYGVSGQPVLRSQLKEALSLKSRISQIKTVSKQDTIGYGRRGALPEGGRIATVAIGYADGLLRAAGNGRFALLIHGHKAPTVGSICMDMCMVDISHIPEAAEGDEVLVFGSSYSVFNLAACLNTIPYEVFTNIGPRVKRVYLQE